MFVRVKSTPNSPRRSVQLVEGIRRDGKVRQRIVCHIGVACDDDELRRLKELGGILKAGIEQRHQPGLFPPEQGDSVVGCNSLRGQSEAMPLDIRARGCRNVGNALSGGLSWASRLQVWFTSPSFRGALYGERSYRRNPLIPSIGSLSVLLLSSHSLNRRSRNAGSQQLHQIVP